MNLLLLLGSIAGVLGLAWAARLLALGGGGIADEAEARRLAEASQLAFIAGEVFLSTDGKSALVRALDGRWAVLKVSGAQVAAREVEPTPSISPTEDGVLVSTGERMFGDVAVRLAADDRDNLLTMT